ncbi:MAG: redoxin domain-containing protein, partial [Ignavibacteriaceae bacterium]
MALKVGDKAPSFKLKNQDGKVISLSNLKGKPVVL